MHSTPSRPVSEPCRVVLVDPRPLVSTALASALTGRDVDVIATCGELSVALDQDGGRPPHVVVLADGPPASGRELLPDLRRRAAHTSVVMVCEMGAEASALVADGLVDAILSPEAGIDRLRRALRRVSAGERVDLSPQRPPRPQRPQARRRRRSPVVLTDRERQVLQLLALGAGNEAIADRLGISVNTVRSHVHSVLRKLGAARRVGAVRRAGELGLLERLSA